MTYPILSTKLFIPQPRKSLVRRQRLYDLIEDNLQSRLILLSAPAGYGKTTLISAWLNQQELPIVWVSMDEADNDFNRFFIYLFEALHRKDPSIGETLLQLLQTMPPAPESFTWLALNELSGVTRDTYLVIDDYHLIENPVIHEVFNQVILNSPRQLHFIVCSRSVLPFSVSRLRALGDLLEITQSELQLTRDEIDEYMNTVMDAKLGPDDISILQSRTEGWLVGLQMAALSLRGRSDPGEFIRSLQGDNRLIADYLLDEVLIQLPVELQNFLVQTSVLNQMEASLCNYVLQIENSLEMLEIVDKRRLFIIPQDDYRHWFRYHHMFREMMRDRLMHRAPDIVKVLNQRAAAWHVEYGLKGEAVEYALEACDYSHAMSILREIAMDRVLIGQWNQVRSWFDRVPKEVFFSYPDLWVIYFMALINLGLISEAREKLEEISAQDLDGLTISREELNRVKGELAICRGVVILHGQIDPALAKTTLSEARRYLTGDETFRWPFVLFNYGVSCFELGDVREARKAFEETVALSKKMDFSLARLIGKGYLADTIAMTGDYETANEFFEESLRYAHRAGLHEGAVFAKTNLGLGSLLYEWNQLDGSLKYIREGIRLAEQGGYLNQLLFGYTTFVRLQSLQVGGLGVHGMIQQLRKMCSKYGDPPLAVSYVDALQAEAALLAGDTALMISWLDSRRNTPDAGINLFSHYERLTLARVMIALGKFGEIRDVIRPIWEASLRQGRVRDAVACEVILAKGLFMKGESLPAIKILERAFYKAEAGNFVRTFLDEGVVLVSMIKHVLSSRQEKKPTGEDCSSQYLYFLLAEVAKDALVVSSDRLPSKTNLETEPLTEHELRILRYIEEGYPNKQIAREMNISLNTVKYHLKNMYAKLGVVNRTQAARMARKDE